MPPTQTPEQIIEELQNLLPAHAERMVSEYKARLGSKISQLTSRVPARGTEVSAELGYVILIRLHEVLDTLRESGIKC